MFTLAALFAVVMQVPAFAATTEFPIKGNEKILISVPDAIITIQASNSKTFRVTLANGAPNEYSVQAVGNEFQIKPKEAVSKETFGKAGPQKKVIEISGPSLPLEIHAFDGQIQLNQWEREALLHLQKGRIVSRGGSGTLQVYSQSGEISVLNHQGRVNVETYKAVVSIRKLTGDAKIENFAGETLIEQARGFLSLNQTQGSAKILGSLGPFQFDTNKAALSLQNIQGRIEGQTVEGPVNVKLGSEIDVDIRSQSGKVSLSVPANSGAALNLATAGGPILVPSPLRASREGGQSSLRGRLKGEIQKGQITIRSQEGSISIR